MRRPITNEGESISLRRYTTIEKRVKTNKTKKKKPKRNR